MRESIDQEELAVWHRRFAPEAFNHVWSLLDRTDLSREEEEDMLAAAFTQRYHWYQTDDTQRHAVADWQVSRVAAVLGYSDLARRFGERSLHLSTRHDLGPFIVGFAHEAIARAAAYVDDVETFTRHLEAARALLPEIEDPDKRTLLAADLDEMSEP